MFNYQIPFNFLGTPYTWIRNFNSKSKKKYSLLCWKYNNSYHISYHQNKHIDVFAEQMFQDKPLLCGDSQCPEKWW